MRGICLFGGTGQRLGRYTRRVANKHLILIGDKTIADLTAERMVETGLTRSSFVTGANYAGQLVTYFGDGKEWGFEEIDYKFQHQPDGIPSALLAAENYCHGNKVFVHLGDNIIDHNFRKDWEEFMEMGKGCKIFLRAVDDPSNFGVAEISTHRIASLVEKPKNPKSNLAIIGAYFFDETVFERARKLKKSPRGETEITELLNLYLLDSQVSYKILDCFYADAGTPEQIARVVKWYYEKKWKKPLA